MLVDIRPDHLQIVKNILQTHVPDHQVWIFGSRVKQTAKHFSDLDICIKGQKQLTFSILAHLRDDFSESNLPYKVDVVDWYDMNETFRRIVGRDKVSLFELKNTET